MNIMDPVLYLDPTTLFICVLVGVGTWFVFLRYRSHDSSSTNKEYTESLTLELSEKEEEIKRLEESVKRLDVVNQSLTMELSEKEEEITRTHEEERTDLYEEVDQQEQAHRRLKQELDKEIKAHKREKAQLLETIRRRKEEIRKDRENESRLKKTIKVLTAECTELRNSNNDVRVTLAEKENKLGEARQQLKALHATIESKEKAVEELGEKIREQRRIISDLDSKRQEETIQQLQDENSRLRDEMSKITKPKQRNKVQNAKHKGEYCRIYNWNGSNVSLETPSGTYISIYPPHNTSLQEDSLRLGEYPNEIIPLFGLNVDAIDEWIHKNDYQNDKWTKDYSVVAAALVKGSDFFEHFFPRSTDQDERYRICKAANEYRGQRRGFPL